MSKKEEQVSFAGRLAELRSAMGWTQEETARAFRVSLASISLWETGLRLPGGPARVLLERLEAEAGVKKNGTDGAA